MKKFVEQILIFMGCFFVSLLVGRLITVLPQRLFIDNYFEEGLAKYLIMVIFQTAIACIPVYIFIRKYGYRGNNTTNNYPVKSVIITITIAVLLVFLIHTIFTTPNEKFEEFENNEGFALRFIKTIPEAIFFIIAMILGYKSGYKKREKERQELISKKND